MPDDDRVGAPWAAGGSCSAGCSAVVGTVALTAVLVPVHTRSGAHLRGDALPGTRGRLRAGRRLGPALAASLLGRAVAELLLHRAAAHAEGGLGVNVLTLVMFLWCRSRCLGRGLRGPPPRSGDRGPGRGGHPGQAEPHGARRGLRRPASCSTLVRRTFGAELGRARARRYTVARGDAAADAPATLVLVLHDVTLTPPSSGCWPRSRPTSGCSASARSWPARPPPPGSSRPEPDPYSPAGRGLPRPAYAAGRDPGGGRRPCAARRGAGPAPTAPNSWTPSRAPQRG